MEWFDIITIILFVLAIGTFFILLKIKPIDPAGLTQFNIYLGIIGTIASLFGFIIAIVQIRKIASNNQIYQRTFSQTLTDLKNNELISKISRALQNISEIKMLFDEEPTKTRDKFNSLILDLGFLLNNESLKNDQEKINTFLEFFSQIEIKIITHQDLTSEEIRNSFKTFTDLQLFLTQAETIVKTPKNK